MRRWMFLLLVGGVLYAISRLGRTKSARPPFLKRLNETVSIVVWVLLGAYAVAFLYWLYTQIFR